jgi:WS/DGAT/MGAT family acyltransferase
MKQLSGLDSLFLYLETPSTPMHIGSLCIYDQSTAPGKTVGFKDIIRFYDERLHKAKAFRRRLAEVPLGLGHPYWIEDPDFDLEFHLRHIALPKPGDWRQLCILTARLLSRPLDLKRPLWEAWVIEGLDNVEGIPPNSFGVVTKIHHAAIDGISGAEIAAAVHGLSPDDEVTPPDEPWAPEREPTAIEMLARNTLNDLRLPLRLGRLVYDGTKSIGRLAAGLFARQLRWPGGAPRTRFNNSVSPYRVFDAVTLDLEEIRKIRRLVDGATVNDVLLAVCGGALRKYLDSKNELPDESLVAMAPMSIRTDESLRSEGNLVSVMSVPIHSDVADAVGRLDAVHEASVAAKKFTFAAGPQVGMELAELVPSTTSGLLASLYGKFRLAEKVSPTFNTVITNVPIGNAPLYSMGSKMVAYFGLGPAFHGVGLFQSLIGYAGKITVNVVACRDMMPDPAFYCGCIRESYEELRSIAK